jgi:hypothetical protein
MPRISSTAFALLAALWTAAGASADNQINLSLVPPAQPILVGQTIDVKLKATSTSNDQLIGNTFVIIDSIIRWDPSQLEFMGISTAGSVPLLNSYLPSPASDYTGVNELAIPKDGDALYTALANFGSPVAVSATGVQVTTFRFKVRTNFVGGSTVEIVPTLTIRSRADSAVYDGTVPGLDVIGDLTPAVITIAPPVFGDLDGDRIVNGRDLATLLGQWGTSGSGDLSGNGVVGGEDLALVLAAWSATNYDS